MGKVSELSQLIEELNRCGNTLIGISEDLKNLFSGSEEAKEKEPKTKVTEETPAKAFFLSFTSFRMMSTTTRSNTAEIRIVPIFSVIHASISPTPFCYVYGLK